MFFPVMTKNLNWEILTKNLITLKRWDGIKNEKFYCSGVSLKNLIFRGRRGVHKTIYKGGMSKEGGGGRGCAWTVCRFKRGRGKNEVVFLRGGGG